MTNEKTRNNSTKDGDHMSEIEVSNDFLEENKKNLNQFLSRPKKSGPYSSKEKESRRNEVHRLHFDYGYSARKIAELMKINRNTVNGDIGYWYSIIISNSDLLNPEVAVIVALQRFEIQRSRLREQLDKTGHFQEKLALERLMFDIDSKISYTNNKLSESSKKIWDWTIKNINDWLKANKKTDRYMTLFDTIAVSVKAKEKIDKIIAEDRKTRHSK